MSPPLFPHRKRTDAESARAGESTYQFLQRVDDPVFERVRNVLDAWTERFAASQTDQATSDLLGRLRSKQNQQFYAAFWELYLHEVHVRLGFDVEVHPESERGTKPDFVVERGEERFYLEAVMPTVGTGEEPQPKSVQTVLEYIDAAFNPDFFLTVRFVSAGEQTPRKKAVVSAVEGWLNGLSWDDWADDELSPNRAYPEAELAVRDWVLGLRAYPRPANRREDHSFPTIAAYPPMAGWPDAVAAALGPKLDEKASKYGDLRAPYVIAMWVMSPLSSERTAPQALFGIALPLEEGKHPTGLPLTVDDREGLWTPKHQQRGRVSAVLATPSFDFNYSAVARTLPRLWTNPWAAKKLDVGLPFPTSHVSPDETTIENVPASIDAGSLLQLPSDWPGEPFQSER